jgi:nicotinamidase-related amidase
MINLPKSLLQIAGASLAPSPLDRSALVMIDPQLEYLTGAIPLSGIDAAIVEAKRLLKLARNHGMPIFHVVHHGRPGAAAFDPQGQYVNIIPDLAPESGETIVIKALPNAFAGTELQRSIERTGRKELIIAGFATHMCVSTTTRAALDLGFRSTIVAHATATRDLPSTSGGVVLAQQLQEATLAALADRFAIVVRNVEALSATAAAA